MAIQSVLQRSYSLDEFARLNDIALTTVRGEIRSGRLIARKIGRRTIIAAEDANAWLERLPKVQPQARVASIGRGAGGRASSGECGSPKGVRSAIND
jgi:Helix-turn-helix domain